MKREYSLFAVIIVLTAGLAVVTWYAWVSLKDKSSNPSKQSEMSVPRSGRSTQPSEYERNQVKNTILKRSTEIQVCYKSYLKSNPTVTNGPVRMDWQIDRVGAVLNPEVIHSNLGNRELEKCLVSTVQEWAFPPPPDQRLTYIAHTFNFKKVDE